MKRVGVTRARAGLSALLREVKRGQRILITSRGKPVAILAPYDPGILSDDERLADMIARGVVRPPRSGKGIDLDKFRSWERPKLPPGMTVQDLIDWVRGERY